MAERFEAEMKVNDPGDVEVTLTMTMKVRDWRSLLSQMQASSSFPSWKVKAAIAELVSKVESRFDMSPTEKTDG